MSKYVPAPPPRDPHKGTVYVVSKDGTIPKRVEQLIDDRVNRYGYTPAEWRAEVTRQCAGRFLVTGAGIGRAVAVEAGRVGATPVVLPKGAGWLAAKITDIVDGGWPVLVWVKGADQGGQV